MQKMKFYINIIEKNLKNLLIYILVIYYLIIKI